VFTFFASTISYEKIYVLIVKQGYTCCKKSFKYKCTNIYILLEEKMKWAISVSLSIQESEMGYIHFTFYSGATTKNVESLVSKTVFSDGRRCC
jgi:hypothetical protein